MTRWIPFFSILGKDMRNYYLKPPNISWGIVFPVAWTLMFFVRSESPVDLQQLLPGVMAMSILFGTTSMLAVTITFERRSRSFERLLLAPFSVYYLMLAKTSGAIVFGMFNAMVPLVLACLFTDLEILRLWWAALLPGVFLISVSSTFLGLTIAVSVREVFEAQTFSNFFRFPMVFLCGLFLPVQNLPLFLQPLSYALPLTYGVDVLRNAVHGSSVLPLAVNYAILAGFCALLFAITIRNVRRNWVY